MSEEQSNYKTVDFTKDDELNYHLKKWGLRQTKGNREILLSFCQSILQSSQQQVVTHEELDNYIKANGLGLLEKTAINEEAVPSAADIAVTTLKSGDNNGEDKKPHCLARYWAWILFIILFIVVILLIKCCTASETSTTTAATATPGAPLFDKQIDVNGQQLQVRSGGLEEQLLAFLTSAEYSQASADELKDKWFVFDNVNFKFDSATELVEGSEVQLANLAAILRQFPESKIKIGGYTDKKGSDEINLTISQQRADFLQQQMVALGVKKEQFIAAEGYGSRYATVAAEASDSERALDRHMAIRFVK